jgi:hypothetical protein
MKQENLQGANYWQKWGEQQNIALYGKNKIIV